MTLLIFTFLTAFAIEGLGTLVSVIGLSLLFGANPIVIALAIALDVGKIVNVTLLYSRWQAMGITMRTYAFIATAVTMAITSAGAYSFLSGEFQKAMLGTQEGAAQVSILKEQISKYEARKKQIDDQVARIPDTTSARDRTRIVANSKIEQAELRKKIAAIDAELPALQIKQIGVEAKTGPIITISKAFDVTPDEAIKWVILTIIFVFDPLAVFLIVAGNMLLELRRNSVNPVKISPVSISPPVETTIENIPVEPVHLVPQEPLPPIQSVFPIGTPLAPVVSEAPQPLSEDNLSPPMFEVLQATPSTPVEPISNDPISAPSEISVPQEIQATEPLEPTVETETREVITKDQLLTQQTHFPYVSSLNSIKADESVTFDNSPQSEISGHYLNHK